MIPDEAQQLVLDALADRPSGPPGEELLAVLMARAWDEGFSEGYDCDADMHNNPYRKPTNAE